MGDTLRTANILAAPPPSPPPPPTRPGTTTPALNFAFTPEVMGDPLRIPAGLSHVLMLFFYFPTPPAGTRTPALNFAFTPEVMGDPLRIPAGGVPSQSRVGMKDHESLDSRGKRPRRKLFNLELPAEECLSDEDKPDGGLGLGTDKSGRNNNASSSDLHLVRSNGLTDLNEPIQMDKVSASTSVVMSGNHLRSKEEIERQVFFDDLLLSPTNVLMNVSASFP
ncbi:hypothetical protein ACFX11_045288 [Malus domestica]